MKKRYLILPLCLLLACLAEPTEQEVRTSTQSLTVSTEFSAWVAIGFPVEGELQTFLTEEPLVSAPWKEPAPNRSCFIRHSGGKQFVSEYQSRANRDITIRCGTKGDFQVFTLSNYHLGVEVMFVWRNDLNMWVGHECAFGGITPGKRPRLLTSRDGYPNRIPGMFSQRPHCQQ
jgi:hypothetical protein